ncbi:Helicase of the DEAD superfamily [Trachipleistophora hominis]|uniref:ATP-dependent DNA helicase CHL1 n=1 Tax=Trachipleistophora hominis TaxID=72359 RepID=L7JYU8_TRAHO|nr:Helicase of the DEAD superfamily [Trachipleistophora hominis]
MVYDCLPNTRNTREQRGTKSTCYFYPHPMRSLNVTLYDSQKDFIQKAQQTIENNQTAIFSSPTGTGKTLSLLLSVVPYIEKNVVHDFSGVSAANKALINELNFNNTPIYYCSRTHSQLNQAVNELKRLKVACNAVVLGSRMLYCKQPSVNALDNLEMMNERCRELREKDKCEYFINLNGEFDIIRSEFDDHVLSHNNERIAKVEDNHVKYSTFCKKEAEPRKREDDSTSKRSFSQNIAEHSANKARSGKGFGSVAEDLRDVVGKNIGNNVNLYKTVTSLSTSSFKNDGIYDIEDLKNSNCNFCPYYKSKQLSKSASITFLPYQMLFSKDARDSFKLPISNSIIIIDEAHNIYESVIQMNSASVNYHLLKKYIKAFSVYRARFSQTYEVNHFSSGENRNANSFNYKKTIADAFLDILGLLDDFCENNKKYALTEEKCLRVNEFLIKSHLENYNMFKLKEYIRTTNLTQKLEGYEKDLHFGLFTIVNFLVLLTNSDSNGLVLYDANKIRFTPLDPKLYFEDILECKALILAGGTMEPLNNLLSIFENVNVFSYGSICKNFVAYLLTDGPSGKKLRLTFEHRGNEETLNELFNTISNLVNNARSAMLKRNTHGGIVCFLPSKNFLKIVRERFDSKRNSDVSYIFDNLEQFTKECSVKTTVLFAVMGGRLSEGINYSDHFCRLLIIVGIPFPSLNVELRERIKFHGQDYTTVIALKTVNQALGRALRHKNDHSGIVLIDERYGKLQHLLSPWIREKIKKVGFRELFKELHFFLRTCQ